MQPNLTRRIATAAATEGDFSSRFLPRPVDLFGAPLALSTAAPLVTMMMQRPTLNNINSNNANNNQPHHHQHRLLLRSPLMLTLGDFRKLSGMSEEACREQQPSLSHSLFDVLIERQALVCNLDSIHKVSGISKTCNSSSTQQQQQNEQQQNQQGQQQQIHRVFHKGRWRIAGANNKLQPHEDDNNARLKRVAASLLSQTTKQSSSSSANSTWSNSSWFSNPSAVQSLEALFQQHNFSSRMWVSPYALPRTVAANGHRLVCDYVKQESFLPGAVAEKFISAENRKNFRAFRPFHFWGRTGLRVRFGWDVAQAAASISNPSSSSSSSLIQEDFEEEERERNRLEWLRQRELFFQMTRSARGHLSWFSPLDLKLFDLVPKTGEDTPAAQFIEQRNLAVVPLLPDFVDERDLYRLDSLALLPQPPAAMARAAAAATAADSPELQHQNRSNQNRNNNNKVRHVRYLRSDFVWTMLPFSRLELFDQPIVYHNSSSLPSSSSSHSAEDEEEKDQFQQNQNQQQPPAAASTEIDMREIARLCRDEPLVDAAALHQLGVKPRKTLQLQLRLPVSAWNIQQVVPAGEAAHNAALAVFCPWLVQYERMQQQLQQQQQREADYRGEGGGGGSDYESDIFG